MFAAKNEDKTYFMMFNVLIYRIKAIQKQEGILR